jgi:hypothetical protein
MTEDTQGLTAHAVRSPQIGAADRIRDNGHRDDRERLPGGGVNRRPVESPGLVGFRLAVPSRGSTPLQLSLTCLAERLDGRNPLPSSTVLDEPLRSFLNLLAALVLLKYGERGPLGNARVVFDAARAR